MQIKLDPNETRLKQYSAPMKFGKDKKDSDWNQKVNVSGFENSISKIGQIWKHPSPA